MKPDKTGYLKSDFRVFYLTNVEERDIQSHYHDFHKLLIFESGSLSYYIEGETYQLLPYDMVLVPAGEVHRPVFHGDTPYLRLIIYISPAFLEQYEQQGVNLQHCFSRCSREDSRVLRVKNFKESRFYSLFQDMQKSALDIQKLNSTGSKHAVKNKIAFLHLYQQSVLLQLLLLISAHFDGDTIFRPAPSGSNQQVLQALAYINAHLLENISVDQVAANCYLNRSYLMHLFRKETGYTILSYITEKRLFTARTLIQSGVPVTDACMKSGFQSYAAFYRAYRKKFQEAPKLQKK